uniref:C2H2-type domain-containing protein n=1 Tax=Mesocestoides corti TaxID=53468 RepID=A0A5K3FRY0_MESCO
MSYPPNSTEPTDPQPPSASTSSPVTRPITATPLKRTLRPILPKPTTFTPNAEGNFPDEIIEPHPDADPGPSTSVASMDPTVMATSVDSTSDDTCHDWYSFASLLADNAPVVYDALGRKRLMCPMPGCRTTKPYPSGMKVHIRKHIVASPPTRTANNIPEKVTIAAMLPESSTYIVRAKSISQSSILSPELASTICAVEFMQKCQNGDSAYWRVPL